MRVNPPGKGQMTSSIYDFCISPDLLDNTSVPNGDVHDVAVNALNRIDHIGVFDQEFRHCLHLCL